MFEFDFFRSIFGVEYDYVGEVFLVFGEIFYVVWVFVEGMVSGEDKVDSVGDDVGWGEGEVFGVVLLWCQ